MKIEAKIWILIVNLKKVSWIVGIIIIGDYD